MSVTLWTEVLPIVKSFQPEKKTPVFDGSVGGPRRASNTAGSAGRLDSRPRPVDRGATDPSIATWERSALDDHATVDSPSGEPDELVDPFAGLAFQRPLPVTPPAVVDAAEGRLPRAGAQSHTQRELSAPAKGVTTSYATTHASRPGMGNLDNQEGHIFFTSPSEGQRAGVGGTGVRASHISPCGAVAPGSIPASLTTCHFPLSSPSQ